MVGSPDFSGGYQKDGVTRRKEPKSELGSFSLFPPFYKH